MLRSKHSGWTWEGKRTPFGGGGGDIFQSVGNALASIDPGPSIGNALAEVDKGVNQIPGGWVTVGGLALGGAALAYAPEVMALAETAGIAPEAAAVELGIAPVEAATGATVPLESLSWTAPEIGGSTAGGTFGSLSPALPSAGSVGGAGMGLSAELAPGTVLGTGLPGGGAIGASYAAGANGLPATDFFGNYIPASSVNFGGVPETIAGAGTSVNTDMAKLLKQGATSGLSKSLGQVAQGSNASPMNLLTAVRGNQSPFTYQPEQPIQNTKSDLASLVQLLKQG